MFIILFVNTWCVFLLSTLVPIAAKDPNVLFPYLNGKSTDDLRPELTTSQGLGTVLLFPSKYPTRALGYKRSRRRRYTGYLVDNRRMSQAFRFRVVPGLSGQVRSVSFQSRSDPTRYLRHTSRYVYLHQDDHTAEFNSTATWIERYAIDGSSGRTYESASRPGYYLSASRGYIRIDYAKLLKDAYAVENSWDLRVEDEESGDIRERPNKSREKQQFKAGNILYSRYDPTEVLGTTDHSHSDSEARLTDGRNIGRYDTLFHIVPGLNGDKNAVSFRLVMIENYYLIVNDVHYALRRYEDTSEFKIRASLLPVPALDESNGTSFISAYRMDSYLCVHVLDKIQLMRKEHSMSYSQKCSWDLGVVGTNGTVKTTYEDLRFSLKGPNIVGEEQGIPLGSDLLHRSNVVLTANTLAWISGLSYKAPCTHEGPRCSMGLVCKKNACEIIDMSLRHLPVETTPSNAGNIGDVCDPNGQNQCLAGATCTLEGTRSYCMPSNNSVRFYQPSARMHQQRRYYTSMEEVSIIEAERLESSVLSVLDPNQYSARVQSLIASMSKDWGIGIEHNELCEHEKSRCTLGLVCKVAEDNRRRCLS